MARDARCSLLESMGKKDRLQAEASAMSASLMDGRWKLDRPTWEFHKEEAQRWLGRQFLAQGGSGGLAVAAAAEWVYAQWQAARESKGQRLLRLESSLAIAWRGDSNKLVATLGGPDVVASLWSRALAGRSVHGALV